MKTRLEVQDAEQNLRLARANVAAAQRDYQVARVNLDWVTGTLDGGMPRVGGGGDQVARPGWPSRSSGARPTLEKPFHQGLSGVSSKVEAIPT